MSALELPQSGLAVVGALAGLLLLAVLAVTAMSTAKAARHPRGKVGILSDNLILIAPVAPILGLLMVAMFDGPERAFPSWAWIAAVAFIAVYVWLPPVRRARERVTRVHRFPAP